jgi:hypothetical protein
MAIAPLHGRPAPLRIGFDDGDIRPRLRAADDRRAKLGTRARRERRRRIVRFVMRVAIETVLLAGVAWVAWEVWARI